MKRVSVILFAVFLAFCSGSLLARTSKTKRATAPQPSASLATERFAGTYRATPKTSLAHNGANVASVKQYNDLHSLLATLPTDAAMRAKYPGLKKGLHKGWPDQREPEEIRNVRVKSCWIVSAKHEGGASGDRDFHVILSQSPTDFHEVMNAEVSALPKTPNADSGKLTDLRAVFLKLATNPPGGSFTHLTPAKHVAIEGSLYFDGDHGAGGKSDPGPGWAKPQSVWEIHPIYKLTVSSN
jgi:hypothetical protein